MLRSIRWTLQLWHAGLLATVLTAFGGVTFYEIRRSRLAQVDADLERTVQLIAAGVRPPPRGFGPRMIDGRDRHDGRDDHESPPPELPPMQFRLSPALAGRFEPPGDGTYFVIWDGEGRIIDKSAGAADVPEPPRDPNGPPNRWRQPTTSDAGPPPAPPAPQPPTMRQRGSLRESVVQGPFGSRAVVGRSIVADQNELRRVALTMIGTGAGVLGVGLLGGLILASRVTRPIRTITAAAEGIGVSNLSRRIDLTDTESELGRLGSVLNSAFDRLENAVRQQVRFTADASHELRTPLAVMHTSLQLALSRDRTAEEYKKTLGTCHRASTRMKDLVESLLLLAGVDAGQMMLDRRPIDLADVARDGVDLIRPLANEKRVTIESELASVVIDGDALRLGQVVTNLLSNAVRYNHDGGSVRVSVARRGGYAELSVADTGVGIAAEHREHVFGRFYRVDAARSRAEGGSGLGLSIGRSIVEAHGGKITFTNPPEGGTVFTVRLPTARDDDKV